MNGIHLARSETEQRVFLLESESLKKPSSCFYSPLFPDVYVTPARLHATNQHATAHSASLLLSERNN